jgi:hypothetical protein
VEYFITIYCEFLKKIVAGLKEWGDHHRDLIFNRSIQWGTTQYSRLFAQNVGSKQPMIVCGENSLKPNRVASLPWSGKC